MLTLILTLALALTLTLTSGDGRAAHDTGSTKVLVAIFYSNPQKLEVHYRGAVVPPIDGVLNSFNFSMTKPTVDSPCASNAFAAWENKIYVTLCAHPNPSPSPSPSPRPNPHPHPKPHPNPHA